jgi:hypothetical protein
MSAADKTKLDGIETAATAYSDADAVAALAAELALKLNVAAPTATGSMNLTANAGASNNYIISREAGYFAGLMLRTGTSARWLFGINNVAEAGSNAGSNFFMQCYDDAGAYLGTVFSIVRSTQIWTFTQIPVHPTPTAGDNSTKSATTAFVVASFAPKASPSFTGIEILTADAGAGTYHYIRRAAGYEAGYQYQTGTSVRWKTIVSGDAESGANAGSKFKILRYTDAGAYIDTPFEIDRATGAVSILILNVSEIIVGFLEAYGIRPQADTGEGVPTGLTFYKADGTTLVEHIDTANKYHGFGGESTPEAGIDNATFSKLGDVAPKIKMKKLTGTTGAAENGTVNMAHGLTSSKIIGVQVIVHYATGCGISNAYAYAAEYHFDWFYDATNVTVRNHPTSSGSILSKPITVLITYEE